MYAPHETLTTIAPCIKRVYVPNVIDKKRSDIVYAPHHFFKQMKRRRDNVQGDVPLTVQRCMARNAYAVYQKKV